MLLDDRSNTAAVLERIVDDCGLVNVVEQLEALCNEKGHHASYNWQDYELGQLWKKAAKVFSKLNVPDLP